MIKLLILGIWASVVSLGAAFGMMTWQSDQGEVVAPPPPAATLLRTKTISVPMLLEGQVQGYVVSRFEFTVSSEKLSSSGATPESLVADEAFKLIYSRSAADVQIAKKHDLQALTKAIGDGVNRRFGSELIKDVLIESWSYLSKEDLEKLNDK